MNTRVCVAGYFPPPITGQTMATQRLADLISPLAEIDSVNLIEGHQGKVETTATLRSDKVLRYVRSGKKLRQRLQTHPESTMLWTSISPQFLGHLRDLLTIYPALPLSKRTFALSHWGNFDRLFQSPATAATAKVLVKRLHGIVFLNEQLANRCKAWLPPHKRYVIPNTIDDALCTSSDEIIEKQSQRSTRKTLRLLFLSNMIKTKGYWDVLEAIKLLHQRGLDFKACFAGRWISSIDQARFNAFLDSNNLNHLVQHKGVVSDRNIVKQLHLWADVFLLPTYYPTEAQPLVLLEAMSAGTPVITTAHSGIPEMITEGQEGLFVPNQNPAALADAVSKLIDIETWTNASNHAHHRFASTYSPTIVRDQWASILSK